MTRSRHGADVARSQSWGSVPETTVRASVEPRRGAEVTRSRDSIELMLRHGVVIALS